MFQMFTEPNFSTDVPDSDLKSMFSIDINLHVPNNTSDTHSGVHSCI